MIEWCLHSEVDAKYTSKKCKNPEGFFRYPPKTIEWLYFVYPHEQIGKNIDSEKKEEENHIENIIRAHHQFRFFHFCLRVFFFGEVNFCISPAYRLRLGKTWGLEIFPEEGFLEHIDHIKGWVCLARDDEGEQRYHAHLRVLPVYLEIHFGAVSDESSHYCEELVIFAPGHDYLWLLWLWYPFHIFVPLGYNIGVTDGGDRRFKKSWYGDFLRNEYRS